MREFRCRGKGCGKLLFKYNLFAHGRVVIVCPRCHETNTLPGLTVIVGDTSCSHEWVTRVHDSHRGYFLLDTGLAHIPTEGFFGATDGIMPRDVFCIKCSVIGAELDLIKESSVVSE